MAESNHAVCVYGCTQSGPGAHPDVCHHRKWPPIVAHGKEVGLRALVGDPRRVGSGLLYTIPLHREGKYSLFFILVRKMI